MVQSVRSIKSHHRRSTTSRRRALRQAAEALGTIAGFVAFGLAWGAIEAAASAVLEPGLTHREPSGIHLSQPSPPRVDASASILTPASAGGAPSAPPVEASFSGSVRESGVTGGRERVENGRRA